MNSFSEIFLLVGTAIVPIAIVVTLFAGGWRSSNPILRRTLPVLLPALVALSFGTMLMIIDPSVEGRVSLFMDHTLGEHPEMIVQHKDYGDLKILVPMDTDDPSRLAFRLRNLENAQRETVPYGDHLVERVVLYGPGVKLFVNPQDALKKQIDAARKNGVQFRFCENSLVHFNLMPNGMDLYGAVTSDVVPSGFLEIAYLQRHGWQLDP